MMQKFCLLIIAGVLLATTTMAQICPEPGEGFGICVEACSNDSDCKTGELCCDNGCGHGCMRPVEDPCALVRCAAPNCSELSAGTITPEGKCCPVCACRATDGSMVAAGTSFMNDCNTCFCGSTGIAGCTRRACPPTTPPTTSSTGSTTSSTGTTTTTSTGSTPSSTGTTVTDATLPTSSPAVMCPNTSGLIGTCDEKCSSDDECSNGQLCCSNGCGHDCMDPVLDCAAVLCLRPNCTSLSVLVTPKGSCCPVCGCRTPDGDRVAPGETYHPDSCNTCTCFRNGLAACTLAFCPPPTNSTPTPTTPSVDPTEPTTQNCSVTQITGRVRHNQRRRRTRLRFSSDGDPTVTYKCKFNDDNFEDCTSPMIWRNLKRGRHTIIVRALCNGKRTSARRRFRVRVG